MTEALVVSIMIEAMRMATLLAAPMLIGGIGSRFTCFYLPGSNADTGTDISNHPKNGGNDGCIGYSVSMAYSRRLLPIWQVYFPTSPNSLAAKSPSNNPSLYSFKIHKNSNQVISG